MENRCFRTFVFDHELEDEWLGEKIEKKLAVTNVPAVIVPIYLFYVLFGHTGLSFGHKIFYRNGSSRVPSSTSDQAGQCTRPPTRFVRYRPAKRTPRRRVCLFFRKLCVIFADALWTTGTQSRPVAGVNDRHRGYKRRLS